MLCNGGGIIFGVGHKRNRYKFFKINVSIDYPKLKCEKTLLEKKLWKKNCFNSLLIHLFAHEGDVKQELK